MVQSIKEPEHHTSEEGDVGVKRKHLIFSLGGKRYGIPLSLIKEVIGLCQITELPRVPKYYKGFINLRGQIISVIDLRAKLNFAEKNNRETAIIISHVGSIQVGAIVDEVLEVAGYSQNQINLDEAERIERNGDGVYGVAKGADDSLTLLIDIEKSLEKTEFKVIEEPTH